MVSKFLSQKYKDKGHDVFIDKVASKDKGVMYKVLIGQFKNQKEAAAFAKNLYEKEKITVIVIQR